MTVPDQSQTVNVAARLVAMAQSTPEAVAVVEPLGYDRRGKRRYRHFTFRQLDEDSDRIARGLREMGIPEGSRLALLVRPGVDFISLVFGLFKAGMVAILIDPGMGRRNLIGCLVEVEPEGFVAIPAVQAVRTFLRLRFPKARFNVTVGRRWFWGGSTLKRFRRGPYRGSEMTQTGADDLAAIIFTTVCGVRSAWASSTIIGRWAPAGPMPTNALRKTAGCRLNIPSQQSGYIGPSAVSRRWASRPQNQNRSSRSRYPKSPMRCQTSGPSAILAKAFASGRLKYSLVTTGPRTISSPISPLGNSWASSIERIGPSTMRITRQSIPANRLPTQTPAPSRVCSAVRPSTSDADIEATGSASVAP